MSAIPDDAKEAALAELRRRFRKKRTVKRHPQEGLGRKDGFTDEFSDFIEWSKKTEVKISLHDLKMFREYASLEYATYYKRGPRKVKTEEER